MCVASATSDQATDIAPTSDYATLKRDLILAAAYDAALRRGLVTVAVEDDDAAWRLKRLCEQRHRPTSSREAQVTAQTGGQRTHETTIRGARTICYHLFSPEERRRRGTDIGRSSRDDYRRYIDDQVGDIETRNRAGNLREVARLTKVLTGRWKHRGNIMPIKAVDGKPLTESKQLLDAWQAFIGRKFTSADMPGAAYVPVAADDDND